MIEKIHSDEMLSFVIYLGVWIARIQIWAKV